MILIRTFISTLSIAVVVICGLVSPAFALTCGENILQGDDRIYMAASSEERGYLHIETSQAFQDYVDTLIKTRGEKLCALKGCGSLIAPPKTTLYSAPEFAAVVVDHDRYDIDYFRMKFPWVFSNGGYPKIADFLWYGGHALSAGGILSSISIDLSIPTVVAGQSMTMVSRLVSKARPREISDEKGLNRLRAGNFKKIEKQIFPKPPHAIMTEVRCEEPLAALSEQLPCLSSPQDSPPVTQHTSIQIDP